MKFGTSEDIIAGIQSVFENNSKVDKVFIFGSRAKGNYRPGSDIDLAITGTEVTEKDILNLHIKLSELNIPYKVDLLNYRTIKEPELKAHIDRVGIEFYSRWKEYTLGEITHKITDGAHLSPKDFPNGRIMFSVKDMTETGFDYTKPKTISQEDFDNLIKQGCQPDIDDVLIAKDGSVLKHIFRVTTKPDYVLLSSIAIIKPKREFVDSSFLVYTLKNPKITETILNNFVSGSGVPRIVLKDFKKVIASLPPLSDQRAISSILTSLDDKIDLLQRQNRTLEQLAETLFRQWFVEEADVSWNETCLEKHIAVFRGLSYKGSGLTDLNQGLPMHNLNSVYEGGGYKHEGIKFYSGVYRPRHLVSIGDIIVTNTEQGHEHRLIGFPAIVPDSFGELGLFSQHIYKVTVLKNSILSREFVYYLLMTPSVREQIVGATNGSTVNMLAIDGLQRPTFKLPPKEKVDKFTANVKGYWEKKDLNHKQIKALSSLRNSLMPKLMNGEVRVLETSSMLY